MSNIFINDKISFNLLSKSHTGNQKCRILYLENCNLSDLDTDKNSKNTSALQLFNTGYRVIKDPETNSYPMEYWNGCVFIDLDSKNASDIDNIDIDKFEQNLYNIFNQHCYYNFYWMQRSNSGKSWHICFYYNIDKFEKTYDNYIKLVAKSNDFIKQAVVELGFEHWLEEDKKLKETNPKAAGIFDFHNNIVNQLLYLSPNKILFNNTQYYQINNILCNNIFGSYPRLKEILSMEVEEIEEENYTLDKSSIKVFSSKCKPASNIDLSEIGHTHDVRWRIIQTLGVYFNGDKEKTFELYKQLIPEFIKHGKLTNSGPAKTESELKNLFYSNFNSSIRFKNFNKKIVQWCRDTFSLDIAIRQNFEYKFKDNIVYDKVYDLKPNEYLSSIIRDIINIETNKIIHIECGCGVGKTYSAKYLAKPIINKSDKINSLFDLDNHAGKQLRICFVTPMTSINRDNFDNENNWLVIDNEHEIKDNSWRTSNLNICTTWNSFYIRKMDEIHFDIIIFDEIHSLYLYDYRCKDIANIKQKILSIKDSISKNKKIIFLSGTPGFERQEFNTYNIKVNKKENLVPTEIIFYNKNYMGYIVSDISNWVNISSNNQAYIFHNETGSSFVNSLAARGLKIDLAYYKSNKEDTDFVFQNKNTKGQISVFSVYGQSGINIFPDKKTNVYIINNNATEIIQYLNRIRNKNQINKIVVCFKQEDITNHNPKFHNFYSNDLDIANSKIDDINKTYRTGKYSPDKFKTNITDIAQLFSSAINDTNHNRDNHLFLNFFGLSMNVLDFTKSQSTNQIIDFSLNHGNYKSWILCRNTKLFESNIQTIYHRLITNYCEPKLIYLEEDLDDPIIKKLRSDTFAGQICRISESDISYNNKEHTIYINSNNITLNKELDSKTKEYLERILTYYYKIIVGCESLSAALSKFKEFVVQTINKNNTITKTDIKSYATFIEYKQQNRFNHNVCIRIYTDYLRKYDIDKPSKEDIIKMAAIYAGYLYNNQSDKQSFFIGCHKTIYNTNNLYQKYKEWFETNELEYEISEDDILENGADIVKECGQFLMKNRKRGGGGGGANNTKQYVFKNGNGVEMWSNSLNAIAEILGKSVATVKRMRQKGLITEKICNV